MAEKVPENKEQWFVLRISYGREMAIKARLEREGHRVFIPMKYVRLEENGKVTHEWVPAVGNLLFANATYRYLYDFILAEGDRRRTHFMWNRSDKKPIVVPDKQMEDFMRVFELSPTEGGLIDKPLSVGEKVRVTQGVLKGVEGYVLELQGRTYVVVSLLNSIFARARVPRAWLEKI